MILELPRSLPGADVIGLEVARNPTSTTLWKGIDCFRHWRSPPQKEYLSEEPSAGTAIMSHAAYVNLPWDSASSSFTLQDPTDERNRILFQGLDTLPFSALSQANMHHCTEFWWTRIFQNSIEWAGLSLSTSSQPFLMGLGIDSSTAVLIEKEIDDWKWSVHGAGSVFVIESPRNQFSNNSIHSPSAARTHQRDSAQSGSIPLTFRNFAITTEPPSIPLEEHGFHPRL